MSMSREAKHLLAALCLASTVAGCASGPAPNTATAAFDFQDNAIHLLISDLQPTSAAELVAADGQRFPAVGINVVDAPHTAYNPPSSFDFGFGGFGGWGSGFGSGIDFGMPLGGPVPAYSTDQYVSSALIPVPPDYGQNWRTYTVRVQLGNRLITIPAPTPIAG